MIILVFLFHFRGIFEHIWIGRDEFKLGSKHGSECEHVGSVDFCWSSYQMSVLPTPMVILNCCDVFYQTEL